MIHSSSARRLKSATTNVDVSAATAPTSGQVLTATSGTAATWQTPTAPSLGYTQYVATLTQSSTSAPAATVLANDTGLTFTWARSSQGIYTITADSGTPFTANKTVVLLGPPVFPGSTTAAIIQATRTSTTVITITVLTENAVGGSGGVSDGRLTETAFMIRIYP